MHAKVEVAWSTCFGLVFISAEVPRIFFCFVLHEVDIVGDMRNYFRPPDGTEPCAKSRGDI